jgi:hypothetical protein
MQGYMLDAFQCLEQTLSEWLRSSPGTRVPIESMMAKGSEKVAELKGVAQN